MIIGTLENEKEVYSFVVGGLRNKVRERLFRQGKPSPLRPVDRADVDAQTVRENFNTVHFCAVADARSFDSRTPRKHFRF